METLSIENIAKAINAKCKGSAKVTSVSTDTRTIENGALFIALKGENFDGHKFMEKAVELGAVAVVSEYECENIENMIIVDDTQKALIDIARYYRTLFNVSTIGVTGSVGKTSTKEMIACILQYKAKTLKNEGNLNNEIGMPLTVLGLDCSYKYGVFEMGMSNFNEISQLSSICKPDIGVITNIGVSHIENLKTQDNILKAKLEILDYMPPDAPLILNGDDKFLRKVDEMTDHPVMYFGIDTSADIVAKDIRQVDKGTEFTICYYGKSIKAYLPTIGKHNIYNALAGFFVGFLCEMPPQDIVKAMSGYKNSGMRQNIDTKNGIIRITDCYNASPQSMRASLEVALTYPCSGKRVCVLGDMLELGEISEEEHIELGRDVARKNIDELVCYGELAKDIKRGAKMVGMKNARWFDNKNEAAEYLNSILIPGDLVLFKASRGIKLEDVIKQMDGDAQ